MVGLTDGGKRYANLVFSTLNSPRVRRLYRHWIQPPQNGLRMINLDSHVVRFSETSDARIVATNMEKTTRRFVVSEHDDL